MTMLELTFVALVSGAAAAGWYRGLRSVRPAPQRKVVGRIIASFSGRMHSAVCDCSLEHVKPDCTGFWDVGVDLGRGPKWVVCWDCREYYVATDERIAEAQHQNDLALDMMALAAQGARELAKGGDA